MQPYIINSILKFDSATGTALLDTKITFGNRNPLVLGRMVIHGYEVDGVAATDLIHLSLDNKTIRYVANFDDLNVSSNQLSKFITIPYLANGFREHPVMFRNIMFENGNGYEIHNKLTFQLTNDAGTKLVFNKFYLWIDLHFF